MRLSSFLLSSFLKLITFSIIVKTGTWVFTITIGILVRSFLEKSHETFNSANVGIYSKNYIQTVRYILLKLPLNIPYPYHTVV
jgi:hypothetical protein